MLYMQVYFMDHSNTEFIITQSVITALHFKKQYNVKISHTEGEHGGNVFLRNSATHLPDSTVL
jgi:hypothetical protein